MNVLATENLAQIFKDLDRNSDLLHAMQTCKVFYDIGIAQLYWDIHYNSHQEFGTHDVFCSNGRDTMRRIPRSIGLNGVVYPTDPNSANEDDRRRCLYPGRLCGLPDMQSFSYLLQGCRSLRKLVIDACTFYEEPLDLSEGYGIFPQLPITDLSLLGRITVYSNTQSGRSDPYPFHHFLGIASLHTLALGVVTGVGSVLAGLAPYKFNVSSLCKLKTLRLCSSSSFIRKTTQEELAANKNLRLFPGALRNLTSYKGSSGFLIPLRDAGCSLKHLDISDCPMLLVNALSLLEKVAARWPNLESLDITIKEWDAEIWYAISQLFRDFREVKIKYGIGHLNESSILSMTSMFFSGMKNMTTLHIYKPEIRVGWIWSMRPGPVPLATDEVRNLIAGWIKACPNLTEVKLEHDKLFCRKSTDKVHGWFSKEDPPIPSVRPSIQRRPRTNRW
ncbi:hypothetical protein IW261DRAFT_1570375 [Armillaria novae-zelandiae]|uniref:F-box domain-containing protein n=1 Tax=Armillaria novae-zelandiae TaxID=153914 RepID=A0AA39U2K5_9AGAR|nr:hypothetical protein IW261DRAFT_1570375 [Armillaria novae-zelandiae]